MRFSNDHDFHIHSYLSLCSADESENCDAILEISKKNNLKSICITDHFWDSSVPGASEDFYKPQNYERVIKSLPLPTADGINFHFGCESEMDKYFHLGISDKCFDKFEFVIIPTTHLHMTGLTIDPCDSSIERRTELYVERFDKLLDMDIPFEKIGIAHLSCSLMAPEKFENHLAVLNSISEKTFTELFTKAAKKKLGIELNFDIGSYKDENLTTIIKPYVIAKKCGCKFYMGSDAHHPKDLDFCQSVNFDRIIDALKLEESDKFIPRGFEKDF